MVDERGWVTVATLGGRLAVTLDCSPEGVAKFWHCQP